MKKLALAFLSLALTSSFAGATVPLDFSFDTPVLRAKEKPPAITDFDGVVGKWQGHHKLFGALKIEIAGDTTFKAAIGGSVLATGKLLPPSIDTQFTAMDIAITASSFFGRPTAALAEHYLGDSRQVAFNIRQVDANHVSVLGVPFERIK